MKLICCLILALTLLADDTASKKNDDDPTRIRQLINQLGDSSFAVRQAAMKQLWQQGGLSKETLRRFVDLKDAEVAARLRRILEHLEMGISPDMPAEIAQRVYAFHKSDEDERFSILYQLRDAGNHRWAMDLIMSVKDDYQREYLAQNVYESGEDVTRAVLTDSPISDAIDNAIIEKLDWLMDHRFMWEFHPEDAAVYCLVRGIADQRIRQLEQSIDDSQADDEARMKLIWLYRLQGDYERSIAVVAQLKQPRPEIVYHLLVENGSWSKLATLPPDPGSSQWTALCQRVLIHYWAGETVGHQMAQQELENEFTVEDYSGPLANLYLATMNTPWIVANAEKLDRGFAFQLLCYMQRFDQAFAIAGAPADWPKQQQWYRSQIRTLKRKISQYEQRNDTLGSKQADELFSLCRNFAYYTGTLGQPERAITLFDLLIEGIKVRKEEYFRGWNVRIFNNIVDLPAKDSQQRQRVWHYFGVLDMDQELGEASQVLFPDSAATARIWNDLLEDHVDDATQRFKLIAALLKSPYGDPDIDPKLDKLMEIASQKIAQQPRSRRSRMLMSMASTYEIYDRPERARDLRMRAGYQGEATAFRELGDQAAKNENWKDAIQWLEQSYQVSQLNPDLYSIGLAQTRAGNSAAGHSTKTRALLCELHSFYLPWLAQNLQEINEYEQADRLLQITIRGSRFNSDNNFNDHQRLAIQLDERDPYQAAKDWRIATLLYLKYGGHAAVPSLRYHYFSMQAHLAQARGLMREDKIDLAFEVLLKCAEFMASDTSVAEEFVPLLEQAGHSGKADQLFDQVAQRYQAVIEAFPDSALHNNNFAWACARCDRRPADRLKFAQRAVELEPSNTSYMDTLAEIYYLDGQFDQAIALAKKCIRLNPYKEHYRQQLDRFQNRQ